MIRRIYRRIAQRRGVINVAIAICIMQVPTSGAAVEIRCTYHVAKLGARFASLFEAVGTKVLRCRLGRAYAGLGRKEDALRECGRAVELRPVTSDAIEGPI